MRHLTVKVIALLASHPDWMQLGAEFIAVPKRTWRGIVRWELRDKITGKYIAHIDGNEFRNCFEKI